MVLGLRQFLLKAYERSVEREIGDPPAHIAIIQDGNRRFAHRQGRSVHEGHRAGADTAENVLRWCRELGVDELTLYAFSTENFERPVEEQEALFDLLTEKLHTFADAEEVQKHEVDINAIGKIERLPERVQEAVAYAESQTAGFDRFRLNIAIAYGGRSELLSAARDVAADVADGVLTPAEIDIDTIEQRIYNEQIREVDLIIRTGGDERTSNFLPWHANGSEAAVYFCTPYWPEFSKVDFLRAIRTYQFREERWHRTRVQRARALLRAFGELELSEATAINGESSGSRMNSSHEDEEQTTTKH